MAMDENAPFPRLFLRPCYQRLWLDMRLGFCVLGRVAETALNMVVDKPGCLENA